MIAGKIPLVSNSNLTIVFPACLGDTGTEKCSKNVCQIAVEKYGKNFAKINQTLIKNEDMRMTPCSDFQQYNFKTMFFIAFSHYHGSKH
jgi:hypothetical protein